MFVTAFIGGLIIVMHPFTVVPAFFILQNVFFLATLTWITAIMINETVFLWEAIGRISDFFSNVQSIKYFLIFFKDALFYMGFSLGVLYSCSFTRIATDPYFMLTLVSFRFLIFFLIKVLFTYPSKYHIHSFCCISTIH